MMHSELPPTTANTAKGTHRITLVPVLEDNFFFVISNVQTREAVLVDVPVATAALAQLKAEELILKGILNTHHHWDHVGANRDLSTAFPHLAIYGHAQDAHRIPGVTHRVADGDIVEIIGARILVKDTPGHTLGHIIYVLDPSSPQPELFCGDTLFGYGCGKLFEGSFSDMLHSLQWVRNLPDATRVWCAHEYTLKNLTVALALEPENGALKSEKERVQRLRENHGFTVPFDLGTQKRLSPFLRWDDSVLRAATQTTSDLDAFRYVREFRDRY